MGNTLTGLIPTLNNALDTVSRENIGFIGNVNTDARAEMAAVGQTVRSPIVPQAALEDITAGATPAASGTQTITYQDVTIDKSKAYPILWTGEEQLSLRKDGIIDTILADQFAQGFRTLANAVEADLAAKYSAMSRAYGTAGTTPFATADDHTDFAEANRILDDNGAPAMGRVMIVGSAARAKLEGKQASLFKINESGDAGALLRERQMRRLHGFQMGFSGGIKSHTKGTGTGYLAAAAEPVGETDIALDTGTGTILAGDVATFAGDSNKYLVNTTWAATPLVLNETGLVEALADNTAMTIGADYTANMFFHRNALLLSARQPAMPEGGDEADDVITMTDPVSGLTFQVAMYRQYRQVKIEIGLAWGTAAPNGKHGGVLLG